MKLFFVTFIFVTTCQICRTHQVFYQNGKQTDNTEVREHFVDSLNVGRKHHNKIELTLYHIRDSDYVVIKFYTRLRNKAWNLVQTFSFEKDGVMGLDPELSDFNKDGFRDMTYISNVTARGANEVRRLFIYNMNLDKLIYIKNSEDYPNMLYNKELNCIDAFLVYGGCSTVFLKLNGDSLKEFASVELSDGLTVSIYYKNGKEKIIFRDKKNKAGYIRYKNYRPLKEYDE